MNRFRFMLRNYFGFTQQETHGFIILLLLIGLLIAVPLVLKTYRLQHPYDADAYRADQQLLDRAVAELRQVPAPRIDSSAQSLQKPLHTMADKAGARLFRFDPNRISASEWIQLGLPSSIARRIVHYREKGGSFRIKSDLKKIYGFPEHDYRRLYAFVGLPEQLPKATGSPAVAPALPAVSSRPAPFDINLADTAQWKKIRGIGTVLSERIVKFRDKLGGFHSVEQLQEVYGLSQEVYREMTLHVKTGDHHVRKLNVNTADVHLLKSHPYIGYKLAPVIIAYREQHGRYTQAEDLLKIAVMDEEKLGKLKPYLVFE